MAEVVDTTIFFEVKPVGASGGRGAVHVSYPTNTSEVEEQLAFFFKGNGNDDISVVRKDIPNEKVALGFYVKVADVCSSTESCRVQGSLF